MIALDTNLLVRNALSCFGGTAFLGIVTRTSVSVFSTIIMQTA